MADIWIDVDAAVEVFVNADPLIDDTDGKSIEEAVAYDAAGMDLNWNFQTPAGVVTQTNVVPTTAGVYDWTHVGNGMYKIEIPDSGGGSINNDTEGFGWFTGVCTGVLPWKSPIYGFRAAGLTDALVESAYSATRGLAGTALPDAAADAVGGLPISDAGGLDLDLKLANTNEVTAARMGALTDWINGGRLDLILDAILDDTDLIDDGSAGLAKIATDVAAILVDTGTTLPLSIGAIPITPMLDTEDGSSFSAIPDMATATNQAVIAGYIDTEIAAILADTGTTLDGKLDSILADTNELQTDLADGGRLDLLVDAIKAKTDNLPAGIAKNVALSNFEFLMVDSADHVTPKTGLTITAQITKDGGAFAGCSNSAVEIANGVYKINLTQAEMNADVITLKFTASGADQRTITIVTSS